MSTATETIAPTSTQPPTHEMPRWHTRARIVQRRGDIDTYRARFGKEEGERRFLELPGELVMEAEGNLLTTLGADQLLLGIISGVGTLFNTTNATIGVGDANFTTITGTVAVTNGSPTVTGTGTTFTSLTVGNYLTFPGGDGAIYKISLINSNTSITLTTNYAGTTASGLAANSIAVETVGQTDLVATTNKLRHAMDSSYPTHIAGTNTATYQATFSTSQANFNWYEFAIFNASSAGVMLNRRVFGGGLKTSVASWTMQVIVTLA